MKFKKIILGVIAVAVLGGVSVATQSYASPTTTTSNSSVKTKKFVKTKNKCTKGNCKCSGYWGYKHDNGTYEGACSNSDGFGHTCGHGPEKHGLKKW